MISKKVIKEKEFIKKVNPELDKYSNMILFKEQVEATKETIQKCGLPILPIKKTTKQE